MMKKIASQIALIILIGLTMTIHTDLPYRADSLCGIAEPYIFSIPHWEAQHLFDKRWHEIKQDCKDSKAVAEEQIRLVEDYFLLGQQIGELESEMDKDSTSGGAAELERLKMQRAEIEDMVEAIMEGQISQTLAEEGFSSSISSEARFIFPPLDFEFDALPYILIVSPIDRIELIDSFLLKPELTLEEIEIIEDRVERLGVSALVERLGGVATYPSIVSESASLDSTLSTIAHEWMHQYLFFRPLGRRYWAGYEMTTINETVANMAGKEIGSIVYRLYTRETEREGPVPTLDFNTEMREIRIMVDRHLELGQIEEAERLMERRRQFLAGKGYFIRKLNQAYFAFHGTYADTPASVSPIGEQLQELRAQSTSLGEFIAAVAQVSCHDDLKRLLIAH